MADATTIDPADVQFSDAPASLSSGDVQVHGNDAPNMDVHDPETFAGLTTQRAIPILYQQGGQPSGETVQRIYEDALKTATDYRKSQALAAQQATLELRKRQLAVTSGLTTAEESARTAVQKAAEKEQEQWKQGPSAVAAAQKQPGGPEAGELQAASEGQQKDLAAHTQGFATLTRMQGLFDKMVQNTATSGGVLRSGFGFLSPVTNATSLEGREYNAYVDFNLVNLAKGLQGDSASSASKDTIQANMKQALPNDGDNVVSGGHKIYEMMDGAYQGLLAKRNAMVGKQDTTNYDKALVDMQTYLQRPEVQKYNALNPHNQPVVQMGLSPTTQAGIDNVNAGANAGMGPPTQMTPTGYVSGPGTATAGPAAQRAVQAHQLAAYPTITNDAGGPALGLNLPNLRGLLPHPGGSQDPNLVMPPGSQGPVTWGQ